MFMHVSYIAMFQNCGCVTAKVDPDIDRRKNGLLRATFGFRENKNNFIALVTSPEREATNVIDWGPRQQT